MEMGQDAEGVAVVRDTRTERSGPGGNVEEMWRGRRWTEEEEHRKVRVQWQVLGYGA